MLNVTSPIRVGRSCRASSLVAALFVIGCLVGWSPAPVFAQGTAWDIIAPSGLQPAAGRELASALDPVRDDFWLVDGDGSTWTLPMSTGAAWARRATSTFSRSSCDRAIFDALGDRLILLQADMKVFSLNPAAPNAWVRLLPSGTPPPARDFFAVTHDRTRNRLLLFGGGPYNGVWNDVWALSLGANPAWQQIIRGGDIPLPAWGPIAVYDSNRDALIVGSGATDINYAVHARFWRLPLADGGSWTELQPSTAPPARMLSAAVFDPAGDRLVLFSGFGVNLGDTWELSFSGQVQWTSLTPTGLTPAARWSSTFAYRESAPAMIMFGGHNGSNFVDNWALRLGPDLSVIAIHSFSPLGGVVGTPVTILGARLDRATEVRFNGVPSVIQSVLPGQLTTIVPNGATTGPISLLSSQGVVTSASDFFVGVAPRLDGLQPDSARAGEVIALRGEHFTGTVRVRLGGAEVGQFSVMNDTLIMVTVDTLSRSGPVTVQTPAATTISTFEFLLISDQMRPRLLSVRDVPGDQGGKVVLRWRASDFDQARYRRVKGYRVWRRAPVAAAPGAVRAGALNARGAALGDPDVFWESLVDLPAASLGGYAYTAPTVSDSMASGNPYTAFFVQVLTNDAFEFFASSPDSGYSVDNLSPPTPSQLTVRYGTTSNQLHWTARVVTDQAGFELHRATRADFVPDVTTLVSRVQDTTFVDTPGSFTYKLAAIDLHGNRSHFLTVQPDRPVATLVSIASQERRPGTIEIRWFVSGNAALQAVVERRSSGFDWRPRTLATADGSGYIRFVDDGLPDDETFEYRLRIDEPEGPVWLGQITFDPLGTITGPTVRIPNPSAGGRIAFELSGFGAHPVQVQLFDITGRLMESRRLESGVGAPAQVAFGQTRRLNAGVYLVRVTDASAAIARRVVVLD